MQLRSADGNPWNLAGQNYRLYYDATLASWQSGVSVLSTSDYQPFTLIEDLQNVNADIGSNLVFEDSLSFLNYSMDLTNVSTGGTMLPIDGSWLTTSRLCFHLSDSLLNNLGACLETIWARDTLTAAYATSFVEVAEWIMMDSTEMADGALYDDLEATDGNGSCFNNVCRFDYGDLPDSSDTTNTNDYQTLAAQNGPAHLIINGLSMGIQIDSETNGQPTTDATGDDADEDGVTIFPTLNLSSGITFRLPFFYINTTVERLI
ncbi:MAG: hypothetical protein AAF960_08045 [Bacteroidota bacterium]